MARSEPESGTKSATYGFDRPGVVLKRLLCTEIGSPPPGAEATPLPDASEELVTTRQRIEALTSAPTCMGCHQQLINPAGFGLEMFDGIGRLRTEDNGAPIDATGSIYLGRAGSVPYDGPAQYAEVLASSQTAAECYVDNSPPPPPREAVAPAGIRDRGTGRPTKRDRRDMERLRGLAEAANADRHRRPT